MAFTSPALTNLKLSPSHTEYIPRLPNEIWIQILYETDPFTLWMSGRRACRFFRQISEEVHTTLILPQATLIGHFTRCHGCRKRISGYGPTSEDILDVELPHSKLSFYRMEPPRGDWALFTRCNLEQWYDPAKHHFKIRFQLRAMEIYLDNDHRAKHGLVTTENIRLVFYKCHTYGSTDGETLRVPWKNWVLNYYSEIEKARMNEKIDDEIRSKSDYFRERFGIKN